MFLNWKYHVADNWLRKLCLKNQTWNMLDSLVLGSLLINVFNNFVLQLRWWLPLIFKSLWVWNKLRDLILLNHLLLSILNVCWVDLKSKGESWTHSLLWVYLDIAIELGDNLFWDCKSEPHTIFVLLLCLLKETKKLEVLLLIFFRDANTGIRNCYLKIVSIDLNFHMYLSSLSELKSIALKS